MAVRAKPNYGIYPIPLAAPGYMDLPVLGTRIILVGAFSGAAFSLISGSIVLSGGTPAPNTIVNVQIGKALGDPIPFGINTKVNVDDSFDFVRLTWAVQPGITVFFLIADDREGAGVSVDAPTPILGGTVSILEGSAATPHRVSVTNAAAAIDATAARIAITITNLDAAETIWLGKDNTVTNATGYPLPAGASITLDHSNGAVWAISNIAGGVNVALLVEA